MTAGAHAPARFRPRPRLVPAALALALVAVWTGTVVALVAGVALPGSALLLGVLFTSIFALPPMFAAALFFGAGRALPILYPLTIWMTVLLGAALAAAFVQQAPLVALGAPGVLLAAVFVTRHRVAAVVLAFLLAGTFGSLTAFTSLRVGPVVDVLLGGLILGAVWGRLAGRPAGAVRLWPGVVVLGAFLFVCALGVLLAPTLTWGLLSFRAAAWYLLAFALVAYLPWRPGDLERVARGVVVVAAGVSAYAVFRWIAGPSAPEWELAISSASIYNFVDGKLRAFGSFTSGHELGAWAASIVPFSAAYALTFRDRWGAIAAVGAGLGIAAIFGSEVRIGVIAVTLGLAVVLFLFQFSRGFAGLHLGLTATLVLGVGTAGLIAFSMVVGGDPGRSERYANILTPDRDPAYQARLLKWQTAVAALDEKPFGHGLGTAGRVQRRSGRFVSVASVNVDNAYLKIAWEQGYAVLALYVAGLLLLLWGIARRAMLTFDRHRAGLAIGAAGTLTAFCVLLFAALYDEGLTALAAWIVVGIGVGQFARPAGAQRAPGSA